MGGPQLGYASLADGVCCGWREDDGVGAGAKLSSVDDGGGALPGPEDDKALDGKPSIHTTHTVTHLAFHFDTPGGSTRTIQNNTV